MKNINELNVNKYLRPITSISDADIRAPKILPKWSKDAIQEHSSNDRVTWGLYFWSRISVGASHPIPIPRQNSLKNTENDVVIMIFVLIEKFVLRRAQTE